MEGCLSNEEAENICNQIGNVSSKDYMFLQTCYRIKDPKKSLHFYSKILGMTLMKKLDIPQAKFSVYFLGFEDRSSIPKDEKERTMWAMTSCKSTLELTHNWGTEFKEDFKYEIGTGFGHIAICVPDVNKACEKFELLGAEFKKRPNDGAMKGIAFLIDPDGYSVEVFDRKSVEDNAP